MFRRLGPPLVAGGATLTLLYAYYRTRPAPAPNPLRTPGVKNIEGAYRGAGATGTHTPAYGGTTRGERAHDDFHGDGDGSQARPAGPEAKSAGKRQFSVAGPNGESGSDGHDMGDVQRPPSAQAIGPGKMWNKFKYGSEDQK